MQKEQISKYQNDLLIVGTGVMGTAMAKFDSESALRTRAASYRETQNFTELISNSEMLLLATRQEEGLKWLREYGRELKSGQVVLSLLAFVDFNTLELAGNNLAMRLVRIMTDKSLSKLTWSDDGKMDNDGQVKSKINQTLELVSQTQEYVGSRKDDLILKETLKACELGFTASVLACEVEASSELLGISEEQTQNQMDDRLRSLLAFRDQGVSYKQIEEDVATYGGATAAGILKVGDLSKQAALGKINAAIDKGLEKRQNYRSQWCDMI